MLIKKAFFVFQLGGFADLAHHTVIESAPYDTEESKSLKEFCDQHICCKYRSDVFEIFFGYFAFEFFAAFHYAAKIVAFAAGDDTFFIPRKRSFQDSDSELFLARVTVIKSISRRDLIA